MARPNVTVIIDDQSFVIPGSESGGAFRGGFISENGLVANLGVTSERNTGMMIISNNRDWFGKLSSGDAVESGITVDGLWHTSRVAGGNVTGNTGEERWPHGPMNGGQYTIISNMVVLLLLVPPEPKKVQFLQLIPYPINRLNLMV